MPFSTIATEPVATKWGRVPLWRAERWFVGSALVAYVMFQRGFHESAPLYLSVPSLMALLGIELVTLLLAIKYYRQVWPVIRANPALTTFVLLLIASSFWSLNPAHSLIWGWHTALTTLMGIYLAVRLTPSEMAQLLGVTLLILAVLSLVAVLAKPGAAIHTNIHAGLWRGVYFHKNGLSREMAIAFILLLVCRQKRVLSPLVAWSGMALAWLLIWKAGAATGLLSLLAVMALYPFVRAMRFQYSIRILVQVVLIVSAGLIAVYLVQYYESALAMIGKDATLTNRTRIWAYALSNIIDRPLLGYGFNAFWLDQQRVLTDINWMSPHAHNHFLELLLDAGLVGMALFLYCTVRIAIKGWQAISRRHHEAAWFLLILPLLILTTLTEIGIHWPYNINLLLFAYMVAYTNTGLESRNEPSPVTENSLEISP